jgi:hypothetical protein
VDIGKILMESPEIGKSAAGEVTSQRIGLVEISQ